MYVELQQGCAKVGYQSEGSVACKQPPSLESLAAFSLSQNLLHNPLITRLSTQELRAYIDIKTYNIAELRFSEFDTCFIIA